MSREEDAVRSTTRAIAATVRDVPPLELEPAPGEPRFPRRRTRRTRRGGIGRPGNGPHLLPWLAPLAAAAAVVAVAASLVLVRGTQNGGGVPQPALTGSGPAGLPRYYVAIDRASETPGAANSLFVGDTVAGRTLAVITPTAHMSYQSVTAAADDRTFLAFATEAGGPWNAGRWYELRLAPGTAHPVSVTATAIGPQSTVLASALSASGRYLAVAEGGPARGQQRLLVFSVATGRPLRAWSTTTSPPMWGYGVPTQMNLLTWIDGDRAIAFAAIDRAGTQSVRSLSLGAPPGNRDLIADSQPIWSSQPKTGWPCMSAPPVVSADGRTITCGVVLIKRPSASQVQRTFAWHTYQASAEAPTAGKYRIAGQVTVLVPKSAGWTTWSIGTLWASPSGSALVGQWSMGRLPASPGTGATASPGTGQRQYHADVISHGELTPLRLPPGVVSLPAPPFIAW